MVVQRSRCLTEHLDKDPVPSEGLYYCLRFPKGWYPLAYRFDDLPELEHGAFWQKHVAPVLACLWVERTRTDADQLEWELCTRQYAFPRGRVILTLGTYRVSYGEELPASISKNMINRAFGLPASTVWESDLHQSCLVADRDYVRQRLGITETWPAVD